MNREINITHVQNIICYTCTSMHAPSFISHELYIKRWQENIKLSTSRYTVTSHTLHYYASKKTSGVRDYKLTWMIQRFSPQVQCQIGDFVDVIAIGKFSFMILNDAHECRGTMVFFNIPFSTCVSRFLWGGGVVRGDEAQYFISLVRKRL